MDLKVSRRELKIIICSLQGTTYSEYKEESEKQELLTRLVEILKYERERYEI